MILVQKYNNTQVLSLRSDALRAPVFAALALNMKRVLLIIFTALLCSCDSGVEWKDSPYEVIWIDTSDN